MHNEYRDTVIYYLRERGGLSWRDLGDVVGLHYSGCLRRYRQLTDEDKARLIARVRGERKESDRGN